MIPNLVGAISSSPVLIDSLVGLFGKVHGGSFTEAQVQILLLTDAVTNGSAWAAAFHTTLALKEGIDPADVRAIRQGRLPKNGKLAALSGVAKTMIESADISMTRTSIDSSRPGSPARRDRRGRRIDDHELCRRHHEPPLEGRFRNAPGGVEASDWRKSS